MANVTELQSFAHQGRMGNNAASFVLGQIETIKISPDLLHKKVRSISQIFD
jgi:hypothetical protein